MALLSRDPALCAKLLKAVNSCLYGLSRPVSSLDRAVVILGMNTLRSLALSLSLPAMRVGAATDKRLQDYWLSSVGGAIIARELAIRQRRPCPEDDLVAGLLRDLGAILLQQTFPDAWEEMVTREADRMVEDPCEPEMELFGIDHADISAELLRSWNLPQDIVEPIRHHHHPERLLGAGKALVARAELLCFANLLVNLDSVTQQPALLRQLLDTAQERYNLSRSDLVGFLESVVPKVDQFSQLINQDIGLCPDFPSILQTGSQELVNLTVEQSRSKLSGSMPVTVTYRKPVDVTLPNEMGSKGWKPKPKGVVAPYPPEPETVDFRVEVGDNEPPCGGILGGYELQELLGRGSMGMVFKAYEPSLDRQVAVKILAPELAGNTLFRQRFTREARVAAAIQHENVVAIYAVREESGVLYLAMEYVDGGSLQDCLDRSGPLPIPAVIRAALEVASGLAAAHAKNIIHRDIKPANILLDNRTGLVKITDFGLARAADDVSLSTDGSLKGTPLFMAPEQILGQPLGAGSDLFSLGGVLYALCTGHSPFEGGNMITVLRAVCETDPPPLRLNRPEVPEWLEAMVVRLLQKNPADRFQSADEVVATIHANHWDSNAV